MQKLINVLALTSFAVSAGVVGAGAYVYLNKDALIDQAKDKAAEEIAGLLPEMVDSLLPKPELPVDTDVPVPVPSVFLPF